jgi:hypothetical protein
MYCRKAYALFNSGFIKNCILSFCRHTFCKRDLHDEKTLFYVLLLSFITSCNNDESQQDDTTTEENTEKTEATKKISKRDYSINSSNSYSNLFLDSSAMESFIVSKK